METRNYNTKLKAVHTKVNGYRPITLLPIIAKNMEKIILNRLWTTTGHNIPNYQFGFKEKTSTINQIMIITSNVQPSKLLGHHSAVVFLDIKKAFDIV